MASTPPLGSKSLFAVPQSPAAPRPDFETVAQSVREHLVSQAARQTRRMSPSPSSPPPPPFSTVLILNAKGHFLPGLTASEDEDFVSAQITVTNGRVRFDLATIQGLRVYCGDPQTPEGLKMSAQALLALNGLVLTEIGTSQATLAAPEGAIDILRPLDRDHVSGMQAFIRQALKTIGGQIGMTSLGNLTTMSLLPNVLKISLCLDEAGHVTGCDFSQMDYGSPRGTVYESGFSNDQNTRVIGIWEPITETMLRYNDSFHGNDRQKQAMRVLFEAKAEKRRRFLKIHPFFDAILDSKPEGQWILQASFLIKSDLLKPKITHVSILKTDEGYRFSQKTASEEIASFRVSVDCQSPHLSCDIDDLEGEIPAEMNPVLDWIVARLNSPLL